MLIDLKGMAAESPAAWKSTIFGKVASANLKVLRMDECAYDAETHEYAEALIVLDGCMHLSIADRTVTVKAGEVFVVPPGLHHGVAPGSHGTLLIVDPSAAA